ncbi:hypothetical protein Nepgr_006404 [Nepenthes gracilis]|uniref:Uncharacterized protein n=1 Tax=Nepenthes gracilis TaxID=150966 RepID=A0AAD3S4Y1_NEPGR|nr:hypothetical protein Nepgr_006404 [Nepenthes gracilis]
MSFLSVNLLTAAARAHHLHLLFFAVVLPFYHGINILSFSSTSAGRINSGWEIAILAPLIHPMEIELLPLVSGKMRL